MATSSCDIPLKRSRLDNDVSRENDTDSTDVRNSRATDGVTLPCEVSRWKVEHIQSISITIQYEGNMNPFQLLSSFYADDNPHLKESLTELIPAVEHFFTSGLCSFHRFLNHDFDSLELGTAQELRDPDMYKSSLFLRTWQTILHKTSNSPKLKEWCRKFECMGEKFGETLYYMVLRKNLRERANRNTTAHPLCQYDFLRLFDAFVSMFGLRNYTLSKPFMRSSKMQISGVQISGNTDIVYCKDITDVPYNAVWEDLCHIVAVCKVMEHFSWTERKSSESDVSSTKSQKLPDHVSAEVLGQHGGELLLYYPHSYRYTMRPVQDSILGMIVQETKVTFTALKMTQGEYDALCAGKCGSISPKMIVTRPYDFMKKEDRTHLIKPLLALAVIQNS